MKKFKQMLILAFEGHRVQLLQIAPFSGFYNTVQILSGIKLESAFRQLLYCKFFSSSFSELEIKNQTRYLVFPEITRVHFFRHGLLSEENEKFSFLFAGK